MLQKTRYSPVKEIMQRKVFSVYPHQSIFDASVLMAFEKIGTVPVVKEDSTLVGIITDRDIVTRCNAIGKDPRKTKVFECMTPNPVRTVPSATLGDTMTLMAECGFRRLAVVEKDKLVGIISSSDIAKVSCACPNTRNPDETCILLSMAKEIGKSSHCMATCSLNENDYDDE